MAFRDHLAPVIGALVLSAFAHSPPVSAGTLPTEVQVHTLDNGLQVYLAPMDSPGVVSWQLRMAVGSGDETEPGTTGFAHFFEHLMFHDTTTMTREQRQAALNLLGVSDNAWTWTDETVYHAVIPPSALPDLIALEADRFRNLALTPDGVRREAGAVYGEFRKGRTDPLNVALEAHFNAAFDVHPYHHDTIGVEDDIAAMPEQHALAMSFFDTWYRPGQARLVVAGDIDPAATLSLIEQHFGPWEAGPEPPPRPPEPPQEAPRRAYTAWDGGPTNALLLMGWRVPGFDPRSPDAAALSLIEDLLLSDVAPLYRDLVVDDPLTYELWGGSWRWVDPHLFLVTAELRDPADLAEVEARVLAALEPLAQGIDPAVLDRAKGHALRAARLGLDNPTSVAGALGAFTRVDPAPDAIDAFYANFEALTVEDVQRVITTYFVPERLTVTVLDPTQQPPPAPAEPEEEAP
ncbi:MAG: insulinase family protein [Alphaproteobacteria bacterium]|nr:insulinase family protein [Alphaproteobacteria bacterium]